MEEDMFSDFDDDIKVDIDESELEFRDRIDESNELVKILNQKCVKCFEQDSDYVFKQCGHQCNCEQCYQNKGRIDKLRRVICRS